MDTEFIKAFMKVAEENGVIPFLCKSCEIEDSQIRVLQIKKIKPCHARRELNPEKANFKHVNITNCVNDTCKIAGWNGYITGDALYVLV